jgi:hypothetical protein
MITLKRIALNSLPALLAGTFLVGTTGALAAPAAGDAQGQARELLVAPAGDAASAAPRLVIRSSGRAPDAARAARGLILGSQDPGELPASAQTLQARATPLAAALRTARTARQDAQAQARHLLRGAA